MLRESSSEGECECPPAARPERKGKKREHEEESWRRSQEGQRRGGMGGPGGFNDFSRLGPGCSGCQWVKGQRKKKDANICSVVRPKCQWQATAAAGGGEGEGGGLKVAPLSEAGSDRSERAQPTERGSPVPVSFGSGYGEPVKEGVSLARGTTRRASGGAI